MAKIPPFDPIEYLVLQRFPAARAPRLPPSLSRPGGGISHGPGEELLSQIRDYENELRAKPPAELQALVDQERAKVASELRERAELEERQRFFNQPSARADFEHWSKAVGKSSLTSYALSITRKMSNGRRSSPKEAP
jgi:hypothetical protein